MEAFIKKGEKLTPLASTTGDVGLMQVNRVTLVQDLRYQGAERRHQYAGAEILHYYLTRFAIPKKEDKQVGGHLARATYSAYNAGPGGLARYRGVRQGATWKIVDEAFWTKFQAASSGQQPAVKSVSPRKMGDSHYRKRCAPTLFLYENRYFGDGSHSPSILQVLEKALKFTEVPCEGGNSFRG